MRIQLNLNDWQGNRETIANTIGNLLHDYPNDYRIQVLLDGFYSVQLHVDSLVLQLRKLMEENSRKNREATKKLITDVATFKGRG